ncbi:peptidyl-prolyl cis-trans isomerase [Paenibacillus sp. JX-17]|uniref:peptidylprolyl isomerase n=1 Tax=Paenibacillus lacisoli TaxID=3064525 RepID=A0ABT9CLV9_9BACL|nr:peptidyl-prolyl cis-trans isomerase [Paenibacillus sp. JX-17]
MLWSAVIVLTVGVLVLSGWIVRQGLLEESEDRRSSDGDALYGDQPVASIGNDSISNRDWVRQLKNHYGQAVLMQMLNRKAVGLEAQARNLTASADEVQAQLKQAMEGYSSETDYYREMKTQFGLTSAELRQEAEYQVLLLKIATADIEVSDEEVGEYIAEHASEFDSRVRMNLSVIRVQDEKTAGRVLDSLADGVPFEEVAEEVLRDADVREQGGDLGWVDAEDPFQPKEILSAAARLQAGDMAGPIVLEDGDYAVVYVKEIERSPAMNTTDARHKAKKEIKLSRAMPLEQVEGNLRVKYGAKVIKSAPAS